MASADETIGDGGLYAAVGARIRLLRERAGMTQDGLGTATGMNPGFVWRVEAGRQNLSLKTIGRIALALDVEIVELFAGIEPDASVMEPRKGTAALRRAAAGDDGAISAPRGRGRAPTR